MGSIKICTKLVYFVQFFKTINKFKVAMSEINITYNSPNAKPERNKKLYSKYLVLRNSGESYDDTMYELSKEFNLSRTRIGMILSQINKKLKNSKK